MDDTCVHCLRVLFGGMELDGIRKTCEMKIELKLKNFHNGGLFVDDKFFGVYHFNKSRGCSCEDYYTIKTDSGAYNFRGRNIKEHHIFEILNKEASTESKEFAEKVLRECVDCEREMA